MLATDCVTARYMGFDPQKISYLLYFLNNFDKYGVDYNSIKVINGCSITNF